MMAKIATEFPLTRLCTITKQACDALTPMIVQFYSAINSDTSKLKADKSVFTIADGTVQHLLVEHLFSGNKFKAVVGEEECTVNLTVKPYTVDDLTIPDEFCPAVEHARDEMQRLRNEIPNAPKYGDLTIFIDPIDGTREFSSGKGEQCSICIGFADGEGKAQAGVVYRPITAPPTWAAGAVLEEYKDGRLDVAAVKNDNGTSSSSSNKSSTALTTPTIKGTNEEMTNVGGGLLTSNGTISPFLSDVMSELNYSRVPSGGAGNKMLMLLEGKADAYIQDRGVSRWDTCGAQACIEAYGGVLTKLSEFTGNGIGPPGTMATYTYSESINNVDFVPGLSWMTAYNARRKEDAPKKNESKRKAEQVDEIQPYANLCGLFAVGPTMCDEHSLTKIMEGCQRAKMVHPPSFD